jgi:hypothetical protein
MARRHPSRLAVAGVLACVVVSIAIGAVGQPASDSWRPSPDLLPRLAPADHVGVYQLRPPIGYQPQDREGPSGVLTRAWVGASRSDRTHPYVMMTLAVSPAEAAPLPLEEILGRMLTPLRQRRRNWTESPPEMGTLGGIAFARAYWTGTDAATRLPMHGFSYVALDGPTVIHISSQDVAPHIREALALAETAVLTFGRR